VRRISNKTGFAATLLGAVLLLELAVIRVAFTADNDFAYFLGHRINVVCAARQHFGVPCPTCGLTRGFVLSVHGHIGEAWRLSPAGPLAVLGMLGMGLTLLALGSLERQRTSADLSMMKRWIERSALAYGALATVIWISSWISVITRLK
jgi:hypothetical protein